MPRHRPRLPQTATVDERTVQKAARAEVPKQRRRRRPAGSPAVADSWRRLLFDDLDPGLRAYLLEQGVNPAHVQVLGPLDVILWRRPEPWPDVA
jgi:hypothetical protein